ncbi:O-acetylhomoserine sulfhydrylase / O-succinylhomoserine sulfhydrylase [hydrothermal vent metagenome]|uniref:O-acetylhomoserine sulfhydrylase / O-succinylhomoserine sulfhydrylase n=1 Tax=hydrothermal vent metagenome TaxID=652676 RepID=A0A3B1EA16_9ZZZZ
MNLNKFYTKIINLTSNKKGPVSTPIVNSASFAYGDSATAVERFSGDLQNPQYARMGNPTNIKLEKAMTTIEGGIQAFCTSSGMASVSMAVLSLAIAGDEIIVVGGLFGGTYSFFKNFCSRCGIKSHFFEADDFDGIKTAINDKTKIIFCESVGNPNLKLTNLPILGKIATENKIAFIVDNTVTPLSIKPIDFGADIVIYSTTKIIAGNTSALGGIAVFRQLQENDKFYTKRYKEILEPFLKEHPKDALARIARPILRDIGFAGNAMSSYLTLLGLETLPLRLDRIKTSSNVVAKELQKHGFNVRHPSLQNHENNDLFNSLYNGYSGSLLTIDFENNKEAFDFLDKCSLITITANICDARTLGLHMKSTIYKDYDEKTRKFLGITDGLVRISIGLEDPMDIVNDFIQARG